MTANLVPNAFLQQKKSIAFTLFVVGIKLKQAPITLFPRPRAREKKKPAIHFLVMSQIRNTKIRNENKMK